MGFIFLLDRDSCMLPTRTFNTEAPAAAARDRNAVEYFQLCWFDWTRLSLKSAEADWPQMTLIKCFGNRPRTWPQPRFHWHVFSLRQALASFGPHAPHRHSIRRCRRVDRAVRSQSHTSRATGGALLAWLPYEKRTFKLLPTIYDTVACGLRLE